MQPELTKKKVLLFLSNNSHFDEIQKIETELDCKNISFEDVEEKIDFIHAAGLIDSTLVLTRTNYNKVKDIF